MKRLIIILLVVIVLAGAVVADTKSNSLVGKWTRGDVNDNITITFKDDGTAKTVRIINEADIYKVDKNKLTMSREGVASGNFDYIIDGDKLVIVDSDNKIEFKRVK